MLDPPLTVCPPPAGVTFETLTGLRRLIKRMLVNPLANHLPAGMVRGLLRFGKSELANANWSDPGGWKSMVICYAAAPTYLADRILVAGGSMPMALRNRRRLAARLLAELIDSAAASPVHVLCLGAGPGQIIVDALRQARADSHATLVDLSSDAFDYGRSLALRSGLGGRLRFIQSDVCHLRQYLRQTPHVVKMVGICEYLDDAQVAEITRAVAEVMPSGASFVTNSLSAAHGTDRFFRRVFGLHMIHRSPEQLTRLMQPAGLTDFRVHPEPLGVYHVIVARKA